MNIRKAYLLVFTVTLFSLMGCQDEKKRNIPDVSDIPMDISIHRFEQDLFQCDTSNMENALALIMEQYPAFGDIFFNQLLHADDERVAPLGPAPYIQGFVQYPPLRALYDTTQIVYNDMSIYEEAFEEAFRYYSHYFPGAPVPTVTTFIAEYSIAAFIYGENDLAVGLDYFLGEDYPYQEYNPGSPAFSDYMARTYTPEHMVAKTLQALADDMVTPSKQMRLLDLMIQNGKKLYLLDLFLPHTPDSIKLEITSQQTEWLNNNERAIWSFLIKEELLYSSEWEKIRKLVEYSPNSPGMPAEAPGRSANWIGWQIIKSFIENNPDVSLESMLAMEDAQALLDAAKYKPRK
ncbi:MAG: hypothetical protein MI974_08260 [Chitinophagales bacterium]|nr:hypothetical protein [Chitinophagales bacterium]